jgi:hypothetical protein
MFSLTSSTYSPDQPVANTHSAGLPWTTKRAVVEASNCTTHTIHMRQTTMTLVGFETAIPARD